MSVSPTIEFPNGTRFGFEDTLHGVGKLETPELEIFMEKLGFMLARRKTPRPAERELALVKHIYELSSSKFQARYDELAEKLRLGKLTAAEHEELLKINDLEEESRTLWLAALIELSQIRGTSVENTLRQLGLDKLKHLNHEPTAVRQSV